MRRLALTLLAILLPALVAAQTGSPTTQTTIQGVAFPGGASSFADTIVGFTAGAYGIPEGAFTDASHAIGAPDYTGGRLDGKTAVSLGNGGTLIVKFTDNALTPSGDDKLDLWIFEVGSLVEKAAISVSSNGESWIDVGTIEGATSAVDLDRFIGQGIEADGRYTYVKIVDDSADHEQNAPYAGADIDAVGAISSIAIEPTYPDTDKDGVIDPWDNCPWTTPEDHDCIDKHGCPCEMTYTKEEVVQILCSLLCMKEGDITVDLTEIESALQGSCMRRE